MRRNNVVFLVGQVVQPEGRVVDVDGVPTPVIHMAVRTDPASQEQPTVVVRGRQALELSHFLQASPTPLRVMVLGWLHSPSQGPGWVMADRVTAIAPHPVRQAAIASLRRARGGH